MARSIVGARIRERRRKLGITQADLARRVGISPSYLNLIERNRRGIAGKLLRRVAEALEMRLDELDGAEERRLLEALDEVAADVAFEACKVEVDNAGELIGRFPGWARVIEMLARSGRDLGELARVLSDRLNHDPFLGQTVHQMLTHIAALRSAAEIIEAVPDLSAGERRRFEDILGSESRRLSSVGEALAAYFDKAESASRTVTPADEVAAFFEARENRFAEIDTALMGVPKALDVVAARAEAAARIGETIDNLVATAPQIETEPARARARERLLDYAVDALMTPEHSFRPAAISAGFDIERLAEQLGLGVDLVCRRLSSLQPDAETPRFGYLSINAAGAVLDLRSLPGFAPARHGAGCPLWVLYRAPQTPMMVCCQHAVFPSGAGFLFAARSRLSGRAGFDQSRPPVTDMLVLAEGDAGKTVYGIRRDGVAEEVGTSCRICPREDCRHRVADPLV